MAFVRDKIIESLSLAIASIGESANHPNQVPFSMELSAPRAAQHGDYATNVAMTLTRVLKRNPRQIAEQIVARFEDPHGIIEKMEIAGPGFINFFVKPRAWVGILHEILSDPLHYGRQNLGLGRRVQVEFVSANPTGPLHIGHGRGAATGDVLASLLSACGYRVDREYYINDAGNQMNTLGASLYYRYQELFDESMEFPQGHYQGEYMKDLAREFFEEFGERYRKVPLEEVLPAFSRYTGERILKGIQEDLNAFGIRFDNWFSEQGLHDAGVIEKTLEELREKGYIYEHEGATWFRSTDFGDEKDRVVIRANGISTYFAADLAYHKNKFFRNYDLLVDIWGADHHGYVDRMLAGIQAMGRKREDLQIVLVQLVNLLRGGKPVAMSTRAGEFVTLREVVDEVGKDAARYIFLTRRSDSPLDFDLDLAKTQSNDNPVFYVQYAHARLCRVFEVGQERGFSFQWSPRQMEECMQRLTLPQERMLLKMLGEYPATLASSARSLEPHQIPYYLHELVSSFHSYYNQNRILGDDIQLSKARLCLAAAVKQVIANALGLLGVDAPHRM